jgi:cobalt-precorrin-5B (C1)-methyltransferase
LITSGDGVVIVTLEGLVVVSGIRIYRVPEKMIFDAARTALLEWKQKYRRAGLAPYGMRAGRRGDRGADIYPLLGKGRISIWEPAHVEPMSDAALVATIELEVKKTLLGESKRVIFVPGKYGRRYAGEFLKLAEEPVECSNFVGDAIDLAVGYGASSILLIGNFGKLVKLAAGIMNTHSAAADGRWEIIGRALALAGARLAFSRATKRLFHRIRC